MLTLIWSHIAITLKTLEGHCRADFVLDQKKIIIIFSVAWHYEPPYLGFHSAMLGRTLHGHCHAGFCLWLSQCHETGDVASILPC